MTQQAENDRVDPHTFTPKIDCEVLETHLLPIEQDVQTLRNLRQADDAYYHSKKEPKPPLDEFLHSQLVTRVATNRAGKVVKNNFDVRHPLVLDCCRILGTDADAVDALVNFLRNGDVSDEGAFRPIARSGLTALRDAYERASRQWDDGNLTIESIEASPTATADDASTIVSHGNMMYGIAEHDPIMVVANEDNVLGAFLESPALNGTVVGDVDSGA